MHKFPIEWERRLRKSFRLIIKVRSLLWRMRDGIALVNWSRWRFFIQSIILICFSLLCVANINSLNRCRDIIKKLEREKVALFSGETVVVSFCEVILGSIRLLLIAVSDIEIEWGGWLGSFWLILNRQWITSSASMATKFLAIIRHDLKNVRTHFFAQSK